MGKKTRPGLNGMSRGEVSQGRVVLKGKISGEGNFQRAERGMM